MGDSVTFVADSRVNMLVEKNIEYNQTAAVNGFRINIYSESGNHSRRGAMAAKMAFSEHFPNAKSYVSFEEPYFKVKIGNFRTRLEATAALDSLKSTYPQAYVVKDKLNVKDLLGIITVVPEEVLEESETETEEN
jgi:hypothetical protein